MFTDLIIRAGSKTLSTAFGSFAVFCLYYTGRVANPDAAWVLLGNTLILGGLATAIVYGQSKWLND
jgi:hypothetical protein